MPWVERSEFEALAAGDLKVELDRCEEVRGRAMRRFWLYLAVCAVLGVVAAAFAFKAFGATGFWVAAAAALMIAIGATLQPIGQARRAIKVPIAEAIARRQGLAWSQGGSPPSFEAAARALFGGYTRKTIGDVWAGEIDGRPFTVFEATLIRQAGKNAQQVFGGQVWRLAAGRPWPAVSVAVPDRGAFNFFKPSGTVARVRFPADAAFERVFEVYGAEPAGTEALFTPELRAELTAIRADAGKTFVYLGDGDVVVALEGPDRFEPGSMFKAEPGQERARRMWNEVDGAVGFARRIAAAFP